MTSSLSEFVAQFDLKFFKGKVIDVIPVTINPGTGNIFEQDVLFQLETGIIISLSDNDLQCKKGDIRQEKRIQIANGSRVSIKKGDDNSKIGIFSDPKNPEFSPLICGKILKIIEPLKGEDKQYKRHAILDVGIGQIWTIIWKNHKENFMDFNEGDYVLIQDGLLDVIKVI